MTDKNFGLDFAEVLRINGLTRVFLLFLFICFSPLAPSYFH